MGEREKEGVSYSNRSCGAFLPPDKRKAKGIGRIGRGKEEGVVGGQSQVKGRGE